MWSRRAPTPSWPPARSSRASPEALLNDKAAVPAPGGGFFRGKVSLVGRVHGRLRGLGIMRRGQPDGALLLAVAGMLAIHTQAALPAPDHALEDRSEERRVGKECRS